MTEHLDVLIVGGGVSGIGAACHLELRRPQTRYAILEARDALGGTWDLFRYPGIRSDSDLYTFGFAFRPWTGEQAIADGAAIKQYLEETAAEHGVTQHVRFGHEVLSAAWDSPTARWTVRVRRDGEETELTCSWLFCGAGYYDYAQGFTPHFEGRDRFAGEVIHPQHWPEDFDGDGKRVVVIGSGATAVTLVPALAAQGAQVTMLQRSPTYVLPVPGRDRLAGRLGRLLGRRRAARVVRGKNILRQLAVYGLAQRFPGQMRAFIRGINEKQLEGTGLDVDVHFKPRYDPWDQRLCAVPDADLYRTLRDGSATIVTDRIAAFDETGIALESGAHLEADVIVTATGLTIRPIGGIALAVDGEDVVLGEHVAFKGCMLDRVPNLVFSVGYTNSSWTLKVDLVCEYLCRMLAFCDEHGHDAMVPEVDRDALDLRPLLDFKAGYVLRALDDMPKQGSTAPWYLSMNVLKDARYLRRSRVDDPAMRCFSATRPTNEAVAA